MSPEPEASSISDQKSGTAHRRRGRPPVPRERLLSAADRLVTPEASAAALTMEAIADAAHVGKGTLFRTFGSRDGLVDALFERRMAKLWEAFDEDDGPLGAATAPRPRFEAVLDALLRFKLENRSLTRLRRESGRSSIRDIEYLRAHDALVQLFREAAAGDAVDARWAAHALLGALRPDVLDDLLAAGETPDSIQSAQRAAVRKLLG